MRLNMQVSNLVLIVCLIFGSSFTYAQQPSQVIIGPPVVFGPPQLRRITLDGKTFIELKVSSERIGRHASSHGALDYLLKIGNVGVRDIARWGGYSSTLMFMISLEEFARMKNGDPIVVSYGGEIVDSFCCLNKKSAKRRKAHF
jgi:hypothetical protein